jgi:hypothetical protein
MLEKIIHLTNIKREPGGSVVGIATGYGLDYRGVRVRVPVRPRIYFSWVHPTSYQMGNGGCFIWGKVAGK